MGEKASQKANLSGYHPPETVFEPAQRPKANEEAADSLFGIWEDNPAVQNVDGFV
jgi:hypothetical protein